MLLYSQYDLLRSHLLREFFLPNLLVIDRSFCELIPSNRESTTRTRSYHSIYTSEAEWDWKDQSGLKVLGLVVR